MNALDEAIKNGQTVADELIASVEAARGGLVQLAESQRRLVADLVAIGLTGEQLLEAVKPIEKLLTHYAAFRDDLAAYVRDMRELIGVGNGPALSIDGTGDTQFIGGLIVQENAHEAP